MLKTQFQRVYNRALREASKNFFFKRHSDAVYQALLDHFSQQLPSLNQVENTIAETLKTKGIFITTLANLNIPLTTELLDGAAHLLPELTAAPPSDKREFLIKVPSDQLLKYSDIFLWGLNEQLLNIIENYLSLPAAYHGVYFRRDLANGIIQRTRRWHLDKEDRRMVKIIIYLNDVSEDRGSFQYIPANFTANITQALKYDYGKITDRMMEKIVPVSQQTSCTGPAGTVIIFDPARVFHRGKVPVSGDRFTLFFDYTSRFPERPYYCKSSFSLTDLSSLAKVFSERQKQCIFWNSSLLKNHHQHLVNVTR